MTRDILQILGGVLLATALVVWWLAATHASYNYFYVSTGFVRCGVDHFPPSCATQEKPQ